MIEFIEKTHQYFVDRQQIKSVTQIIEAKYFCDPWHAEKGKYVHEMIEMYMADNLIESTLDKQLMPYLNAFKKFQIDAPHIHGIVDFKSGIPALWHFLQIAAYMELWQNGIDKDGLRLRNIKKGNETMGFHPVWKYAGTIDLIDVKNDPPRSYILYLKDTGSYTLVIVKSIRKHIQAFLTLVSSANVREEYGI